MPSGSYPVLDFDSYAPFDDEPLGTKDKFWFRVKDGSKTTEWLFKKARAIKSDDSKIVVAGEDWSEKIASEIAKLCGIRAAEVELARYKDQRGCASKNFLEDPDFNLEHGNEILAGYVFGYDSSKRQKQSDHTVDNIVHAVNQMFGEFGGRSAFKDLAHYLVFDALISNTDRHHENWGMLWKLRLDKENSDGSETSNSLIKSYEIAPTFDHASSLGRELLDDEKLKVLELNNVSKYVLKGRGGVYVDPSDRKGKNPLLLVETCYDKYQPYFKPGLLALKRVKLKDILSTVDPVPSEIMSDISKSFAKEMLSFSYGRLTGLL